MFNSRKNDNDWLQKQQHENLTDTEAIEREKIETDHHQDRSTPQDDSEHSPSGDGHGSR